MKQWSWLVVSALTSLLVAPPLWGFELLRVNQNPCDNGARNLLWRSTAHPVDVSRLGDPFRALATEARSNWNDPLRGRFSFVSGSGAECDANDGVTSMDLSDTVCGGGEFGDALAVTRSSWRADGSLVDADVVFNSNSFLVNNESAFRQVAAHELGHVLGLDHSDACGDSGIGTLMRSVLTAPLVGGPQSDDIDGGRFIYSAADVTPTPGGGAVPDGANGCVVAPAPAAPGAVSMFLLAGAFILAGRRRRRHFD